MEKRTPQGKQYISFYITQGVKDGIQLLVERTDIPKTRLYNRAYKNFLEKRDRTIDPRIKIKKRSDPQYIRRDVLVNDYIVKDLYIEMKEVAKENECSVGCVLYAALVSYIAAMDIFLQ